jgi:hypothetical protein
MSVGAVWDNREKTTLRIDCEGPWDWAEYARVIEEALAGLIGKKQAGNFIINLLSEARTPAGDGLSYLEHSARLCQTLPALSSSYAAVQPSWHCLGHCLERLPGRESQPCWRSRWKKRGSSLAHSAEFTQEAKTYFAADSASDKHTRDSVGTGDDATCYADPGGRPAGTRARDGNLGRAE